VRLTNEELPPLPSFLKKKRKKKKRKKKKKKKNPISPP
jgi:hypothetical protein